jgi:hypothetical protein
MYRCKATVIFVFLKQYVKRNYLTNGNHAARRKKNGAEIPHEFHVTVLYEDVVASFDVL